MKKLSFCEVAILAGGQGTRLKSLTGNLPKPLAPLLDIPVMEYQIRQCAANGLKNIAVLVHYQSVVIQEYFGDGARWGVNIQYVIEKNARGTAGAVRDALEFMGDDFLVLYADTYFDVDLINFLNFSKNSGASGSLLLHPNDHPYDSDLVEIDKESYVVAMHPYPHKEGVAYKNLVNAALYWFKKEPLVNSIPVDGKHDLAKDTFTTLLSNGHKLYGYVTPEYIKDMGTPERLDKVEKDLINGLPERLSSRQLRSAMFIDRDGTINVEKNHLSSVDQLELLPESARAIHQLNRSGILSIGITNQPVIARGDATFDDINKIHAKLDQLLGLEYAYLDGMYICPHHPDKGYEGEIPELKINCSCRKPLPGLLHQAMLDFNVNPRNSWMVGDATSDILAGKRAGLRTILVRTGYAGRDNKFDVNPDYICEDLLDAVNWIQKGYPNVRMKLMPIIHDLFGERSILIGGASRSGKSTVAQVAKEMMEELGRTTHIISLDSWLKPKDQRLEGVGVLERYDLSECLKVLQTVIDSNSRMSVEVPFWDRKTSQEMKPRRISIGPEDFLIVEGVPALLDTRFEKLTKNSLFVSIDDIVQRQRVKQEYMWRGMDLDAIQNLIVSRELDEVSKIKARAVVAKYQLNLGSI